MQKLLSKIGIYVYAKPLKFYYDLENEVKNSLIRNANGILHIGGHYGHEGYFYNENKLKVIWIEALPDVHAKLAQSISRYSEQIAYCCLLGDKNMSDVDFFISNNDGSASSIFNISENSNFNSVFVLDKITIPMKRLDNLLSDIYMADYDHWIIDVQGAELLVLQGAGDLISYCNSITVEVSTRETYVNGAKYLELKDFLFNHGFFPLWEPEDRDHTDIPFIRRKST